jgi:hypothetical protein
MSEVQKIRCNMPNDMLSQEELNNIEQKMYSRISGDEITYYGSSSSSNFSSTSGFLAKGEKLQEVINKDNDTLQKLKITHKQIADRLDNIYDQYLSLLFLIRHENEKIRKGLLARKNAKYIDREIKKNKSYESTKYKIETNLFVSTVSYMGAQECPFQNHQLDNSYNGYSYGSTDVTITNIDTKETFTYNTLLPHMIKTHQFFEGSVSHRVDPETVIRILGIKPDVDYESKYINEYGWDLAMSSSKPKMNRNNRTNLHDEDDNGLGSTPSEIEKSILALQTYSRDYTKFITSDKNKPNETYIVHAFLSTNTGYYIRVDNYLEAYEKKMSYREFRRLCHDNERKSLFSHGGFTPKSLIKSDEEIEKLCESEDIDFKRDINDMKTDVYMHLFISKQQTINSPLTGIRDYLFNGILNFFRSPVKVDQDTSNNSNDSKQALEYESDKTKINLFGIDIDIENITGYSNATYIKKKYSRVEI